MKVTKRKLKAIDPVYRSNKKVFHWDMDDDEIGYDYQAVQADNTQRKKKFVVNGVMYEDETNVYF